MVAIYKLRALLVQESWGVDVLLSLMVYNGWVFLRKSELGWVPETKTVGPLNAEADDHDEWHGPFLENVLFNKMHQPAPVGGANWLQSVNHINMMILIWCSRFANDVKWDFTHFKRDHQQEDVAQDRKFAFCCSSSPRATFCSSMPPLLLRLQIVISGDPVVVC